MTGQEAPARPDGVPFRSEILSLTGAPARLWARDEDELMKPLYQTAAETA